jgi:hypothetical protein
MESIALLQKDENSDFREKMKFSCSTALLVGFVIRQIRFRVLSALPCNRLDCAKQPIPSAKDVLRVQAVLWLQLAKKPVRRANYKSYDCSI